MHVLRITEHLLGFYDGRTETTGDPSESWVDDGALALGTCSYAIVDGADAIVYDTHVSLEHARRIRDTVERLGASRIRVVLSHWHLDHIAGNEVFADCEIIATRATGELLAEHRSAIESGTYEGPPPIAPLVLPGTLLDERTRLDTDHLRVELVPFDIHSRDALVIHLPDSGLLLAGDTVEDTVTYVSEADGLERHIDELERMRRLGATAILPNHGSREAIEGGGYRESLIDATRQYVRDLLQRVGEPLEEQRDLRAFIAEQLAAGSLEWFEPYQRVHESNLAEVAGRTRT
jgi:cyclase